MYESRRVVCVCVCVCVCVYLCMYAWLLPDFVSVRGVSALLDSVEKSVTWQMEERRNEDEKGTG